MKIGIFISIFSNDDISSSLRYIVPLVQNIKLYVDNGITFRKVDLLIHTDEFTSKLIKKISAQESINLSKVKFIIHPRNKGLRGMFWRFASFISTEYDITINAEGDYKLDNYLKELEFFEAHPYPIMAFDVRQIAINNNAIAGGKIFIRPGKLPLTTRTKISKFIELMDHIEDIDYGVDENYLINLFKINFKSLRMLFIINDRLNIHDHIKNFALERKNLLSIFKNSDAISISEFNAKINKLNKYLPSICNNLKFVTDKGYIINDYGEYEYKPPFRIPRSEYCQTKLIKTLMSII